MSTNPQPPADPVTAAGEPTAAYQPGTEQVSGAWAAPAERYALGAEIARGGMGVVLRATDRVFQREVAVKVLHPKVGDRAELTRRFIDEARITGRLQHPGVPPVHDLGTLPDGLPFLAMKLIQGRTLAALLRERSSPARDLPRFLQVFEQICQTVAFAHSKEIIHRDLKPANVMVGAFGEVQVMDWGLAKERAAPITAAETPRSGSAPPSDPERAAADAAATGSWRAATPAAGATGSGVALGTPSYMPPEQARGELGTVDARSDVFGLGAILCEILTGRPPFASAEPVEALRRAQRADLADALARLAGCGCDPDLVQLARRCLAPRQDDRPADGSAVATAIADYNAQVQRRLRQMEIDRAAAAARADAERTRRRMAVGLAAALVLLVVGGSIGGYWYQANRMHEAAVRAERQKYVNDNVGAALAEADARRGTLQRKLHDPRQVYALLSDMELWRTDAQAGRAAWQRAQSVAQGDPDLLDANLAAQLAQLERQLADDDNEWALAKALDDVRLEAATLVDGKLDPAYAASKYPAVFATAQLAVQDGKPADVAAQIARSAARYAVVAALDHWAAQTADRDLRTRLLEVTRRADSHPWRDRFRDSRTWERRSDLEQLASELAPAEQSPQIIIALAERLKAVGGDPVDVLRRALRHHRRDFWLHTRLGESAKDAAEMVGAYQSALAIRTQSASACQNLAVALVTRKDVPGAIAMFQQALDISPDAAKIHYNLAVVLRSAKDPAGAAAHLETAARLDSHFALAQVGLGQLRYDQKDFDGATKHLRTAIDIDDRCVAAHNNLGLVYYDRQQFPEAGKQLRRAVELDANAVDPCNNLGQLLYEQKDLEGAMRYWRKAIVLDPRAARPRAGLASALCDKKEMAAALAQARTAVELDPQLPQAHNALGLALFGNNERDAAIAAFQQAIALDPNFALAHARLGVALYAKKDFAAAGKHLATAVQLDPASSAPYLAWANVLFESGRFAAARAKIATFIDRLAPDSPLRPAAQKMRQRFSAFAALETKLTAFLKRGETPADAKELPALAQLCHRYRRDYRAATRLYAAAFAALPPLADDVAAGHRYQAARSAALAASAKDPPPADAEERSKLRRQALRWLHADCALLATRCRARHVESVLHVLDKLPLWQKDDELQSVRDPAALAQLPADERAAWRTLWADADRLLDAVRGAVAQTTAEGTLSATEPQRSHERTLTAGTTYVIEMHSTALDSYLKLLDTRGKLVAENDDIGTGNLDARIVFTPAGNARFRIVATSFQSRGRGAYTLTIRAIAADRK